MHFQVSCVRDGVQGGHEPVHVGRGRSGMGMGSNGDAAVARHGRVAEVNPGSGIRLWGRSWCGPLLGQVGCAR
jgi:hypothetical protein